MGATVIRLEHSVVAPCWSAPWARLDGGPIHRPFGLETQIAARVMRISFLCLAVFCLYSCQSSTTISQAEAAARLPLEHLPAISGDYFRIDSRTVNRPFHIYVRYPERYDADSTVRYPVVYVLDGDSLFPILAANHLFLNYDENLSQAFIVGIAYGSFDPNTNRRKLDFSAPAPDAAADEGGAPEFHEFLKSELIPEIENRYSVDSTRRVLFGQSRGGYMVLYSAFEDPDLFWGRIASNPTFDPGRERFFSPPKAASRNDLALVVTSGSRDRPALRESALQWFEAWTDRTDAPWAVRTVTIEGGTHAANSPDSYRIGMLWLFNRDRAQRPVGQIDHIMIRTGHPETLFTLFAETFGLPVAWPLATRGVTSGGVGFGNVNVEAIHFPVKSATSRAWSVLHSPLGIFTRIDGRTRQT